jgi:hypothetical protein
MGLVIDKEQSNGVVVGFWVADIASLNISVSGDVSGEVIVSGSVRLMGFLSQTLLLAGKTSAAIVVISDLTQDECGDLFKKIGKKNIRKKIYDIVVTRAGWTTAIQDNSNEDLFGPLLSRT